MSSQHRFRGYALALAAAVLWATLGLFYTRLARYGLSLIAIVFLRASLGALLLLVSFAVARQPGLLRFERSDWLLLLGLGFFAVALYFAYASAISLAGMGVAAVLMYTAPAWVTLIGLAFLGERMSWAKAVALVLAGAGCALVGKIYDLGNLRLNLPGILAGLATGLAYAIYIVLSKVGQRGYSPWTVLFYALGLGAVFLIPLQEFTTVAYALTTARVWLVLIGLAIVPTLGGGVAFNAALRELPASEATIVGTLEPAVAALLGWAFLGERLAAWQIVGAGLILAAVVVLQVRRRDEANVRPGTGTRRIRD
jgi:drug/metabolite transporter (DMT)-like permease